MLINHDSIPIWAAISSWLVVLDIPTRDSTVILYVGAGVILFVGYVVYEMVHTKLAKHKTANILARIAPVVRWIVLHLVV